MNPADRHCSLAATGSWTDLLTNVSAFEGSRLDGQLHSLLGYGEAPKSLVLDLLHEATHQWCFSSPVGGVLAYLQARVISLATYEHFGQRIPFEELVEDLVRVETVRELLRPLAEGLAMFMELDATTGARSEMMSSALQTTHMLYLDRESLHVRGTPADLVTHGLQRIMRDARLSPEALQRRVHLLSQPLSMRHGGYLPGYLALKTLWLDSAELSEDSFGLHESDLFASYVRAYFYRDYALVDLLLNPNTSGEESIDTICDYLMERIHAFPSEVRIPEDLIRYDELASRPGQEVDIERYTLDPLEYLHVDEERYLRGAAAWQSLKLWMVSEPRSEADATTKDLQRTLNNSRHFQHLGSASGSVTVTKDGLTTFTTDAGDELWSGQTEFAERKPTQGRLDVFFSTYAPFARMVSLHAGQDLVGVSVSGSLEAEGLPLNEVMQEFHQIVTMREFLAEAVSFVPESLERHGVLETVEEIRKSFLPDRAVEMYWSVGLARLAWDLDENEPALAGDGLLLLPEATRDHLEGAALLGLAAAGGQRSDKLAPLFAERRLSLEDTLGWLQRTIDETGFPGHLSSDGVHFTHF